MTTGIAGGAQGARRADLPDAVRVGTMGLILLFVLIGADPFYDGTAAENAASRRRGNVVNQVLFLVMAPSRPPCWPGAGGRPCGRSPPCRSWRCSAGSASHRSVDRARRLGPPPHLPRDHVRCVVSVLVLARTRASSPTWSAPACSGAPALLPRASSSSPSAPCTRPSTSSSRSMRGAGAASTPQERRRCGHGPVRHRRPVLGRDGPRCSGSWWPCWPRFSSPSPTPRHPWS